MAAPDQRVAVYPGSFDPVTVGHLDIVERGAALFDRIIIAVAPDSSNPDKRPLFTTEERMALLRGACAHLPNVSVEPLQGLLVDFTAARGARVIIKGLRAVSDWCRPWSPRPWRLAGKASPYFADRVPFSFGLETGTV